MDTQVISETISAQERAAIAEDVKKIFDSKPDESLVKAKTFISGLKPSKIWVDASQESRQHKPNESLNYAQVILKSKFGFDNLKIENAVNLAIRLQQTIEQNQSILAAPAGVTRTTDFRLERNGTQSDHEWEMRLTTYGAEDSDTARQRLERLAEGIQFIDNTGANILMFDKFATPKAN